MGPIRLGPGDYACPYCNKILKRRSQMEDHLRKHTGERPFSCPYCNFSSAQKSNLNSHVRKYHAQYHVL